MLIWSYGETSKARELYTSWKDTPKDIYLFNIENICTVVLTISLNSTY